MDISSLIGFILGLFAFFFGVFSAGGFSALEGIYDFPSIIITVFGSISGVLASNKLSDVQSAFKAVKFVFNEQVVNPAETIKNIIDLANVARKEGLLALEEAANNIEDPFLKKGIMLVVDGTDPELVRGILETDLNNVEARHKAVIAIWEKWAALGPAWGMIGTLIGLVDMLRKLDDAAAIGPAMAVALLTTLYGSLIANYLCDPMASKLGINHSIEMMIKDITVEGLLSIQAGENPRIIEEKLKSFLAPGQRETAMEAGAGGVGGEE